MSDEHPRRVEDACAQLLVSGAGITFDASPSKPASDGPPPTAVPNFAPSSKSTASAAAKHSPSPASPSKSTFRTSLQALAAKVRRHEETIRRLERRQRPDQD
jgi:hypothetical protein